MRLSGQLVRLRQNVADVMGVQEESDDDEIDGQNLDIDPDAIDDPVVPLVKPLNQNLSLSEILRSAG